ncbi:MAG: class I SAM-dependent methyltransferase [Bacteroidetes bacterium]|nr:class I SAM-dependent methyltransferase [Bacteroidota bacterium]MBU1483940.1 class I SAM-dependent methyltransferase [Bacteroidota bacterium]MBU2268473.1 class I SAM-dependent methyltransferase [Bacteroidota bacterium]MBU2374545.1 class I SAM-dependent methyltransferase [Bacteroidota bacterium]
MHTFQDYVKAYQNTEKHNDDIWELFKDKVDSIQFLKNHRDDIEERLAGFGDRSFHFMWYLLLQELSTLHRDIQCLEIGIFKGQVISLWALIARELKIPIKTTGISPLDGNYPDILIFRNYYLRRILSLIIPSIKKDFKNGNIHIKEDFTKHIKITFEQSNLNLENVELIKGFSNDATVLSKVKDRKFDLVYIDGDHSYEIAKQDIENYTPLLNKGGFMVLDDSSYFSPGSKFFKGIESCSKAAEEIDPSKFKNVLNIGHNRVFQKL